MTFGTVTLNFKNINKFRNTSSVTYFKSMMIASRIGHFMHGYIRNSDV